MKSFVSDVGWVLVCCFLLLLLVFSCYLYAPCVLCVLVSNTLNIFVLFTYKKKTIAIVSPQIAS